MKLLLHLKKIYGEKISITCGKHFTYLGMQLDYSEPGIFGVSMIPYIDSILEDFPEEITKSSPCPHNQNLFRIRDENEAKYLPEDQAMKFRISAETSTTRHPNRVLLPFESSKEARRG